MLLGRWMFRARCCSPASCPCRAGVGKSLNFDGACQRDTRKTRDMTTHPRPAAVPSPARSPPPMLEGARSPEPQTCSPLPVAINTTPPTAPALDTVGCWTQDITQSPEKPSASRRVKGVPYLRRAGGWAAMHGGDWDTVEQPGPSTPNQQRKRGEEWEQFGVSPHGLGGSWGCLLGIIPSGFYSLGGIPFAWDRHVAPGSSLPSSRTAKEGSF